MKVKELMAHEIKVCEGQLKILRRKFDKANDNNDVQGQIDHAVKIAEIAGRLRYLLLLRKNYGGK